MELTRLGTIRHGQDGAIWGNLLFRLDHQGRCYVYDLNRDGFPEVGYFRLDRWETLCPHSNSVTFGPDYWAEGDEFPLLYSNIYNNYAKAENRLEGTCCVYRIFRENGVFKSTLVQLLKVCFVADEALWGIGDNIRPYGNFVVDRENRILYAFTMRDKEQTTRYFAFPLPDVRAGFQDGWLRICTLEEPLFWFDAPYHRFIQGACVHNGNIISVEGFTGSEQNPPALRVIDPRKREQVAFCLFADMGSRVEPECVDFQGDTCWYSEGRGNLYELKL